VAGQWRALTGPQGQSRVAGEGEGGAWMSLDGSLGDIFGRRVGGNQGRPVFCELGEGRE